MSGLHVAEVEWGSSSWMRTFAAWRGITRAMLDDAALDIVRVVTEDIGESLREQLVDAGWRAADLDASGVGAPAFVMVRSDEGDYWSPFPGVVVLGEARALSLVTPDPMPAFDLFPRWSRLVRLFRRTPR